MREAEADAELARLIRQQREDARGDKGGTRRGAHAVRKRGRLRVGLSTDITEDSASEGVSRSFATVAAPDAGVRLRSEAAGPPIDPTRDRGFRAIERAWSSASTAERKAALEAWARRKTEKHFSSARVRFKLTDELIERLRRRRRPAGQPHAPLLSGRASLVALLDWRDALQLGVRERQGPLGASSRFLSVEEYTLLFIAVGAWGGPRASDTARQIFHREREAMKKAVEKFGQRPVETFEVDAQSAAEAKRRYGRDAARKQPESSEFVRWRVQRGKLDRER